MTQVTIIPIPVPTGTSTTSAEGMPTWAAIIIIVANVGLIAYAAHTMYVLSSWSDRRKERRALKRG